LRGAEQVAGLQLGQGSNTGQPRGDIICDPVAVAAAVGCLDDHVQVDGWRVIWTK
jgi:hypothetical protein